MKKLFVMLAVLFAVAFLTVPARAIALTSRYSPAMEEGNALGGGMLMPMAGMSGTTISVPPVSAGELSAYTPSGTPVLATQDQWVPGSTYDSSLSSTGWYNLLSPTSAGGQGLAFSNQYGFTAQSGLSTTLDNLGLSLGIRLVSSSAGLTFYNTPSTFHQVFAGGDDYVLWSGVGMWHLYAAVAPTEVPTTFTADFEIFVADTRIGTTSGGVDETTTANHQSGYTPGTITLTWTTVPEPSTYGLLGTAAVGFALMFWRKKSNVAQINA